MSAEKRRPWYRLDNAGLLYSSLQREHYSAVYRFSALMTEKVEPELLQKALGLTLPRFPGFAVRIRRGFFWYYLEPNDAPGPFVRPDIANPCQPVRFGRDNGWLIRVYCYERRISLEVFHALSDGAGAMSFLKTLLAVYLRCKGYDIPNSGGVFDIDEEPDPAEFEDAYARWATVRPRRRRWEGFAYLNCGEPEPFYTLNIIMGIIPLDRLRARAKEYGASITEYLSALLIHSIAQAQRSRGFHRQKPVALAVPINLRSWFPSRTLRNFILTVRPCIDPALGEYTLAEIVSQVHHFMRLKVNRQELQAAFAGNVRFSKNPILQAVPVFLKNPVLSLSYHLVGTLPYSATYTNPGAFTVPQEMEPHIERMEVILGQATIPRPTCASISCGNTMTVSFAGTSRDKDAEREFFRTLVREGIPVRIESNRR